MLSVLAWQIRRGERTEPHCATAGAELAARRLQATLWTSPVLTRSADQAVGGPRATRSTSHGTRRQSRHERRAFPLTGKLCCTASIAAGAFHTRVHSQGRAVSVFLLRCGAVPLHCTYASSA